MSELEQLRKEVNELRERVAKLEARPIHHAAPMPSLFLTHVVSPNTSDRISCGDARAAAINQGRAIARGMQAALDVRARNA